MSISSEINRINGNISDAYSVIDEMGGTLPPTQNSANLSSAIMSIPAGGSVQSVNGSLPDAQGNVTVYAAQIKDWESGD